MKIREDIPLEISLSIWLYSESDDPRLKSHLEFVEFGLHIRISVDIPKFPVENRSTSMAGIFQFPISPRSFCFVHWIDFPFGSCAKSSGQRPRFRLGNERVGYLEN